MQVHLPTSCIYGQSWGRSCAFPALPLTQRCACTSSRHTVHTQLDNICGDSMRKLRVMTACAQGPLQSRPVFKAKDFPEPPEDCGLDVETYRKYVKAHVGRDSIPVCHGRGAGQGGVVYLEGVLCPVTMDELGVG